jgi:hypothetical protein
MSPETDSTIRELDHRVSDGIEVTLLWDSRDDRVYVTVEDRRHGHFFDFEVDAAEALEAFHHPYAYGVPSYDGALAV